MPTPSTPSRRPRILQVVSHLALGGAERVTVTLMEALRDEFEFAVHVTHDTPLDAIGESLVQQIRALGIPLFFGTKLSMKRGGLLTGGFALAQTVKRFSPDLVHAHTEIPEAALATALSFSDSLRQLPLVRTIHSSAYWRFWRTVGRWCDRRLAHATIIGVSNSAVSAFSLLRGEAGPQHPATPPEVIYNGVPSSGIASPRVQPDETGPIRLLFAGRLETEKGADLLPAILAQVPAPPRGVRLVIHGEGRHENLLRSLAHRAPLGWSVILQPPVADLAARLSEFDFVLMPSRSEGPGLLAIEAAFAGTPVIATDAPGLREALPPDHPWIAPAGYASHFAATLHSALEQPHLWSDAARRAFDFSRERFSVPTMATKYHQAYQDALDKNLRRYPTFR
jgi:glycosyltransferase involved in cell wall biosynthesis